MLSRRRQSSSAATSCEASGRVPRPLSVLSIGVYTTVVCCLLVVPLVQSGDVVTSNKSNLLKRQDGAATPEGATQGAVASSPQSQPGGESAAPTGGGGAPADPPQPVNPPAATGGSQAAAGTSNPNNAPQSPSGGSQQRAAGNAGDVPPESSGRQKPRQNEAEAGPPAEQQQEPADEAQQPANQEENAPGPARTRKQHKAGRRGRARTKIIRIKMTRRPKPTTPMPPAGNDGGVEPAEAPAERPNYRAPPGENKARSGGVTKAPYPVQRFKATTEEQKLFIVNPQNGVAARPDLAAPDIKSAFQGYNSAKDMISMTQDAAPRKWTSLTITSGSPPFVKGFEKLPRTEKDAVAKGWLPIDDYDCDGEYTNLGRPYMLSEDPAIILLFDKSGYIAGLQTALSETEVWESREQGNTFKIEDSGYFMQIPINGELHFALTALFVEPEIICSTGRTPDEFDEEGTGTGLYIVVAGIAVKMEMRETDLDKNVWMSGNFFPGMGNHYFAQIDRIGSEDHPVCDDWVPFFLLYNRGYLNAFGWTFFGRYKSSRFEYQSTISYPVFMDPIPQCVEEITQAVGMTTFHILFETFYRNLGFR